MKVEAEFERSRVNDGSVQGNKSRMDDAGATHSIALIGRG
jgi:hypothetical protein